MAKAEKDSFQLRYERYLPVIECVAKEKQFRLEQVYQDCQPEKPAFVTRLVNELVQHGWLVTGEESSAYQWNLDRGEFSINRWLDERLFGTQVKATPEEGRPRERLLALGVEKLSIAELLAILIRSGRPGESAVMGGEKISRAFADSLDRLPAAGRGELKAITPAAEKTAYCQIMAGIELGRRIAELKATRTPTKIQGSEDAVVFCERRFSRLMIDSRQEEFHIVTLDTKHQVVDTHQITVGTLDSSLVHPREVFRAAIKDSAAAILLVHNHPSGDSTPSRADHAVTDRLTEAGKLIGIDVLDHIVLASKGSVSLRATK